MPRYRKVEAPKLEPIMASTSLFSNLYGLGTASISSRIVHGLVCIIMYVCGSCVKLVDKVQYDASPGLMWLSSDDLKHD